MFATNTQDKFQLELCVARQNLVVKDILNFFQTPQSVVRYLRSEILENFNLFISTKDPPVRFVELQIAVARLKSKFIQNNAGKQFRAQNRYRAFEVKSD